MPARSISDRQRSWLEEQLADWQERQLVTADQASLILGSYESAAEVSQRKRSKFSYAILGLAAVLVGLALLLLIGYNWDGLWRPVKLGLIFGLIVGTQASGYYLRFVRKAPVASELVFFLGCLFYGAGIWLVAQVFHLNAHYPDGVWWWAVGVLPFALCLDSILLHALLVALLALWAGMEVVGFSKLGLRLFWGWWSLPNGAYSLPLLALPGLVAAYRKPSPLVAGLYAPLLAWWCILQAVAWNSVWMMVYLVGTIGAIFLIVAESHRPGSRFAIPFRFWGVAMAGGVLIPLGFGEFQKEILHPVWTGREAALMPGIICCLVLLILLTVTLALVAYFRPTPQRSSLPHLARLVSVTRRQWLPVGLALGLAGTLLWSAVTRDWVLPTIVANAAIIGLALWLMRVGLRDDRALPFSIGVLYFLGWAVSRYADLLAGAGGMLGASLMFFLCGAALAGMGIFWHKRKQEPTHV